MTDHNLGLFKALPGEVRADIWKNLRPSTPISTSRVVSSDGNSLGVLRAGRQLCEEIIPYLYDEEILDIHVECVSPGWLTVENGRGARWRLTLRQDKLYEGFSNLPYNRLKQLRVLINAKFQGLGQVLFLFNNVRKFVKILERSSGLASIEIHFLDSRPGKWAKPDGKPRSSTTIMHEDYMNALMPFCRLRNVAQVKIHVPVDLVSEGHKLRKAKEVMQSDIPFGAAIGNGSWDDKYVQDFLDDTYLHLTGFLDNTQGPEADMMRLQLFMNWYNGDGDSGYVKEWERMMLRPQQQDRLWRTTQLEARYYCMLSMNPLSVPMQKMRLQLGLPSRYRASFFPLGNCFTMSQCNSYFEKVNLVKSIIEHKEHLDEEREARQDKVAVDRLRPSWSQIAWEEYYPRGIPSPDRNCLRYAVHSDLIDPKMCPEDTDRYKTPKEFLKYINKCSELIDFKAGEETRQALGKAVHENPEESSHKERHKDLGLKVCKVWDEFKL